ncbi:MAG: chemotaxis protein CheW [ANME-2 cluster archaeon]|nr:chemotaxis protein CheW [ANME-2 cluster archaeon]
MTGRVESQEVQVVIFSLGGEEYCVDISCVREIIRMVEITRIPKLPDFVEGVINLRGQITTVIDMRKRFDMELMENDTNRIIIIDLQGEPFGAVVDSVYEVKTISLDLIDSVPSIKHAQTQEYLKGICKIDDRILILLDFEKILSDLELAQTVTMKEEMETVNT